MQINAHKIGAEPFNFLRKKINVATSVIIKKKRAQLTKRIFMPLCGYYQ